MIVIHGRDCDRERMPAEVTAGLGADDAFDAELLWHMEQPLRTCSCFRLPARVPRAS